MSAEQRARRRAYTIRTAVGGWIIVGPDPEALLVDSDKGPPPNLDWPVELQEGEDPERAWQRAVAVLRELVGPPGCCPLVAAQGVALDAIELANELETLVGAEPSTEDAARLSSKLAEVNMRLEMLHS